MKNFNELKSSLTTDINQELESLNLHIYELNNNKDFDDDTLQVLIENKVDPLAPLDLNIITDATELVSNLLDKYDDKIKDQYLLEVASAGIEKPIKTKEQLIKSIDSYVHVELNKPDKNISEFDATLTNFDDKEDLFEFKFFIKGQPKKKKISFDEIKFVRYAIKF